MFTQETKRAVEDTMAFKNETITSIEAQYGTPVARVVDEVTGALLIASGIIRCAGEDSIGKLLVTDLASRLVACVARLSEKAYGMPEEQRQDAIDLAKELHAKLMEKRLE